MTQAHTPAVRPDVDIQEDIESIILRYPPLTNDRHHLTVEVSDGVVILRGYTKTPITRRHLLDTLPTVPGVTGINADRFFDDETIRIDVGQRLPLGVMANVEYGTVILSGRLPEDVNPDALVGSIGMVPGVHRVITAFRI